MVVGVLIICILLYMHKSPFRYEGVDIVDAPMEQKCIYSELGRQYQGNILLEGIVFVFRQNLRKVFTVNTQVLYTAGLNEI